MLYSEFINKAVELNELKNEDRNYFQIFTVAGMPDTIAFNCPRVVKDVNPTKTEDISKALIEARAAILRISNFCKKYIPGFENSYISNISNMLGVRVSRRIKGKYIYKIDDIINSKKFDNPAVISAYPVDVHSTHKDKSKLIKTKEYQLPIESLISADYDNVFFAGRCLSADYISQGALRVQPSCISMGEAVAKYISTISA